MSSITNLRVGIYSLSGNNHPVENPDSKQALFLDLFHIYWLGIQSFPSLLQLLVLQSPAENCVISSIVLEINGDWNKSVWLKCPRPHLSLNVKLSALAIDQFVKRTDVELSTSPPLDLGLGRKAEISEKRRAWGPLFHIYFSRFSHFLIILIARSNVQRFLILPSSFVKL